MYELFKLAYQEADLILKDLSNRLLTRKFFKVVSSEYEQKQPILKDLKKHGYDAKYYFAENHSKQILIYKDGIIEGKDETIYLFDKYELQPLSKVTIFEKSMVAINNKKNQKFYLFVKY
jgi:hypothetical protein